MAYSSDLTDKEWEIVEPLLPQKKQTTPPLGGLARQILKGILYQLKNGCNWGDLPCIPATLLHSILALQAVALRRRVSKGDSRYLVRPSANTGQKKPTWTMLLIIDSQAVKNTCNAGVGSCFYKPTNGIKHHLAVDSLGFPFFIHCSPCQCVR
ncbi:MULTISPECIES: transposase [unclassified Microcoleus]|uniref:transposase n=1 Tax=unclassified Microcoleus TaxID=2642155 RepID=UPI00403FB75E